MSQFIPFSQMVENLFKVNGMHEPGERLMHAAVGIIGEVAELHESTTNKNIIEELGDLAFYIEAARQACPNNHHFARQMYSMDSFLPIMTSIAGQVLDVAKKNWVYGKPIANPGELSALLDRLEDGVCFAAEIIGTSYDVIKIRNQEKLAKRYPEGVYSDLYAQQRADKQGE